jgi:hypothetical protein
MKDAGISGGKYWGPGKIQEYPRRAESRSRVDTRK